MSLIFHLILILFNSPQEIKGTINPDDLKFNELNFQSEKAAIWEKFGVVEPKRVYYECGFHSEDEQGKPFFELIYPNVTWIGNEEEGYILDKVIFETKGKTELHYKDWIFTGTTTQKELEDLFKLEAGPINVSGRENENLEWIGSNFEKGDDGFHFYFKNGKLIEFGYWSPC